MARPTNGFDKRPQAINRKGRPKSFDTLRALMLEIGNEIVSSPDGSIQTTRFQAIIRDWLSSKDFRKQEAALQYAFGKVPDKHEVTGADGGKIVIDWEMNDPDIS